MRGIITKAIFLVSMLGFTVFGSSQQPQPTTKRVVQYYGQQTNSYGTKFHIAKLVNNPNNQTYATNVLMGEFDLHANKTMSLNGNNPADPANEWFWDEIKTVRKGGVRVSMWMRQGFEFLRNDSQFETHYATINATLNKYEFDGIDLDIEDRGSPDAMTLNDTVHLIKRLRDDFGSDFLITLAPTSDALLWASDSTAQFSYKDLEKQAGSDIDWYNAEFYGGSWTGLKSPDFYEKCISQGGWKPERIVTVITTSSDFTYPDPRSSWIGLDETGPTIEKLSVKYANFGGVGGFDYYDAKPGGYAAPWQWSRWAAQRMGIVK
ncbi:glycoside hydrolase [Xylariaceae sp. FL0255]|nr:glycoside hydrolase [Xylariaceae sp. FL0255]